MRRVLWAAAGLAAAFAGAVVWDDAQHAGRILPGVWVGGLPAGGLRPGELEARLRRAAREQLDRELVVRAGPHRWRVRTRDAGLRVDVGAAVRRAYQLGRHPNPVERARERWRLWTGPVTVEVPWRVDHGQVRAFVRRVSRTVHVPPKEGRLVVVSGRVEVVPGEVGAALDEAQAEHALRSALLSFSREAQLSVKVLQPLWTAGRLRALGISDRVASFSTRVSPDPDRTHNIALAASRLRGVLLPTGSELSFNEVVGPRTKEAGFREAPVLVEDELVPGDGGGVCQVSSTLFNAALLADLVVTRRANHTQPVPYVPLGRDATVVHGSLDLRVRNDGPPVLLWSELAGDRLVVSIYGRPQPGRRIRVLVERVEVIPPPRGAVVRPDAQLRPGEVRVLPARPGYRATTVREVWEAGVLVRREVVARSVYRPVARTVKVGAGRTSDSRPLRP
ncbi:MAG: VanW family protein [Armatimonadota bacterium]|nr:VanW family protein [Armatimonadota bacterium]